MTAYIEIMGVVALIIAFLSVGVGAAAGKGTGTVCAALLSVVSLGYFTQKDLMPWQEIPREGYAVVAKLAIDPVSARRIATDMADGRITNYEWLTLRDDHDARAAAKRRQAAKQGLAKQLATPPGAGS